MSDLSERDIRQREIVPPAKLAACYAVVIGVGAIGRQVALQLATLGMTEMLLVDHDLVSVENLAPQGYWPEDLGKQKVEVTAKLCRSVNPQSVVHTPCERFRRSSARDLPQSHKRLVLFCCVDSISTRGLIWEAVKGRVDLFIDGRMNAEVIRVLAAHTPCTDLHYPATLFTEEQAYAGSCTAKSTVYTASIAAGLMLGQFTKWLRGLPVDPDITLNLLAAELTIPAVDLSI